jgi:hypothetical protein
MNPHLQDHNDTFADPPDSFVYQHDQLNQVFVQGTGGPLRSLPAPVAISWAFMLRVVPEIPHAIVVDSSLRALWFDAWSCCHGSMLPLRVCFTAIEGMDSAEFLHKAAVVQEEALSAMPLILGAGTTMQRFSGVPPVLRDAMAQAWGVHPMVLFTYRFGIGFVCFEHSTAVNLKPGIGGPRQATTDRICARMVATVRRGQPLALHANLSLAGVGVTRRKRKVLRHVVIGTMLASDDTVDLAISQLVAEAMCFQSQQQQRAQTSASPLLAVSSAEPITVGEGTDDRATDIITVRTCDSQFDDGDLLDDAPEEDDDVALRDLRAFMANEPSTEIMSPAEMNAVDPLGQRRRAANLAVMTSSPVEQTLPRFTFPEHPPVASSRSMDGLETTTSSHLSATPSTVDLARQLSATTLPEEQMPFIPTFAVSHDCTLQVKVQCHLCGATVCNSGYHVATVSCGGMTNHVVCALCVNKRVKALVDGGRINLDELECLDSECLGGKWEFNDFGALLVPAVRRLWCRKTIELARLEVEIDVKRRIAASPATARAQR